MWKKKEEKKEEKEVSLLEELCGGDAQLYEFLSNYLFIDPLSAISQKDLDILIKEGEKSGDFRPAVDKAIFEGAQNLGESKRYIKVLQNLALKTIHATEQEKERVEKEGLTDRAASLGRVIERQKFMSERVQDILNVASKFYNERLLELGEKDRREERREERVKASAEEWRKGELERAERETRKKEERHMGREERREAKKQDKREELAAEARKEARKEERKEAEEEEKKIEELEKAARETRKKERRGN